MLLNLLAPAGHWHAASATLPCTDVEVPKHTEHDLTIRAARMLRCSFQVFTTIRMYRAYMGVENKCCFFSVFVAEKMPGNETLDPDVLSRLYSTVNCRTH